MPAGALTPDASLPSSTWWRATAADLGTANGETVTSLRAADPQVPYDERGRDHFVWVDRQGKLRVSPTDPGAKSEAGAVVGRQA